MTWNCSGNDPSCRPSNRCADGCHDCLPGCPKHKPNKDQVTSAMQRVVDRFVAEHGRLPEFCTRCERFEDTCLHKPNKENKR